jgi:hypothetical protein
MYTVVVKCGKLVHKLPFPENTLKKLIENGTNKEINTRFPYRNQV